MRKALILTFLLSLLFPQCAMAQQPIAPVPMTPFGDGQASVLTGNLQYQVLQTTFVVVVPAGFVTDFASTPRALWSVIPPTGRYQLAAVVHDFLYWDQGCTREQADAIFRVAMAESNVKPFERGSNVASGAPLRAIGVERECSGEASGKSANRSGRLYEHSPTGNVAGLSGPTRDARHQTCVDTGDTPGVLRGGNKCGAAIAVSRSSIYVQSAYAFSVPIRARVGRCPFFLGVKPTWFSRRKMSACDPKRTRTETWFLHCPCASGS